MKFFKKFLDSVSRNRARSKLLNEKDVLKKRIRKLYFDNLEKAEEVMKVPRSRRKTLTKNGIKKGPKKEVLISDLSNWKIEASIKTRIRWHAVYASTLEEPMRSKEFCRFSKEKETFWMIEELTRRGKNLSEILCMCGERFATYKREYFFNNINVSNQKEIYMK